LSYDIPAECRALLAAFWAECKVLLASIRAGCRALLAEYRALLAEYKDLSNPPTKEQTDSASHDLSAKCRNFLVEYRALLAEFMAHLAEYRAP